MIFVTTGQRIAVENFSKGVIYKVTFTDESISYMMCVGIGKDFVMLQSTDPLLFSLTMQSASRVSTIDVHDPTPPTPIENALQYQTGEPPFTFTTTESSLFSWYIEGPCGVKTANLFDYNSIGNIYPNPETSTVRTGLIVDGLEENADYYLSFINPNLSQIFYARFNGNTRLDVSSLNTRENVLIPMTGANAIRFWVAEGGSWNGITNIMLNKGSTALPYEPYGLYKISILSNDNAETIYLDEALAESERLYSVNIDTVIVTDIGENTFSVTPTPPEMQIVYGIYAEA